VPGTVRDTLRACGFNGSTAEGALLTSELATNAVLHTRAPFTITITVTRDGQRARIEVSDTSDTLPREPNNDLETPGGQGLRIVDAIADRWGIEPHDGDGLSGSRSPLNQPRQPPSSTVQTVPVDPGGIAVSPPHTEGCVHGVGD
jgi:anti-sigma regulatory factor (Ser/Thr protein kinase)